MYNHAIIILFNHAIGISFNYAITNYSTTLSVMQPRYQYIIQQLYSSIFGKYIWYIAPVLRC